MLHLKIEISADYPEIKGKHVNLLTCDCAILLHNLLKRKKSKEQGTKMKCFRHLDY
jgi:hypothetical protein